MFIKKSFVDEITASMERNLVDGAIDKLAAQEEKIVKAAEYLNSAAEIFDESGMTVQAEVITAVLESLAGKKDKKKKKVKNKKSKSKKLTSEKMVKNLEEKGWVFDEDGKDDHNHSEDCSLCGDMMYADDEDKLNAMLDHFKGSDDMDFEDELDFDGFENRI